MRHPKATLLFVALSVLISAATACADGAPRARSTLTTRRTPTAAIDLSRATAR